MGSADSSRPDGEQLSFWVAARANGSGSGPGGSSAAALSAPRPLAVGDAVEVARFEAKIVRGPAVGDCWIWIGALGNDGYGRFWVTRDGMDVMVRPSRYAVALATGEPVPPDLVAMHDRCDNPICVRAAWVGTSPPHVVLGTQADNLSSMGSKRRGGGQRPLWKHDGLTRAERVARSKALRDAVRTGWNGDAVRRALLVGGGRPTLFGADGMP